MYEKTKKAANSYITSVINDRLAEASHIGPEYVHFWQSVDSVTMRGGKRVRPYLTMVGFGHFSDAIVPVAIAQEFIHIATLIHDDVIDQDTIRHGSDNITGIYLKRYTNHIDSKQSLHYAYGASILAGDALLSEAYRLIHDAELPLETTQLLARRLHRSVYEVIGGEVMDVEAPILKTLTDPMDIYRYKTASYSFVGPLLSGAYCANASPETIATLEQYGQAIGIGFQLQDDLLGVFGDEETTGKSTSTDLREAKATMLVATHKRLMDESQRLRFEAFFGNTKAGIEDIEKLRRDLIDSGAKKSY